MRPDPTIDSFQEDIEMPESGYEFSSTAGDSIQHEGRGMARVLSLFGFAAFAAGLTLAFAPEYSWQVQKAGHQLQALGIQNGTLIMGGLILFGMGLMGRARVSHVSPAEVDQDSDFMLVADQLVTDLARINTSMLQVQGELGAIEEAQNRLAERRASDDADSAEQHNSMFRFAASLDKLSAQVDQGLTRLRTELRNGLAGVAEPRAGMPRVASAQEPAPQKDAGPSTGEAFGKVAPSDKREAKPSGSESHAFEPAIEMPTSSAFLHPTEEPSPALPLNLSVKLPTDPSQEVFDAFEGLEKGDRR